MLPFSLCTFSGSKSLHFIISLEDSALNEAAYSKLVRMVYAIVKRNDQSCGNANRLTRLPNAQRRLADGTYISQELLAVRSRVTQEALCNWAKQVAPIDYNRWLLAERALIERQERQRLEEKDISEGGLQLSATAQQLVYHGAIAPGRTRHEALQKLAAELLIKETPIEVVEELLYKAQDAIGLGAERDDAKGLLLWYSRKSVHAFIS